MIHFSKPTEWTAPRANCHLTIGLQVIKMCGCINGNKHTSLVGDVDNGERCLHVCGQGAYGKSPYLTLNFAVNLKLC